MECPDDDCGFEGEPREVTRHMVENHSEDLAFEMDATLERVRDAR